MWRASLVIILSLCCVYAQVPAPQLRVSGRILKSGSLSLAPSAGVSALESVRGSMSTQVRLRVRRLSGNAISIPLIARSNSPYQLIVRFATDLSLEESETLRVAIRSVDPIAGGTHLTPDATNVVAIPGELTRASDQIIVGRGPRISQAGNDWTIDNAIRLTLDLELPHDTPEAEVIVTMEFVGE
jgi:hypothetical protein